MTAYDVLEDRHVGTFAVAGSGFCRMALRTMSGMIV